jgi:hypothetical protein
MHGLNEEQKVFSILSPILGGQSARCPIGSVKKHTARCKFAFAERHSGHGRKRDVNIRNIAPLAGFSSCQFC